MENKPLALFTVALKESLSDRAFIRMTLSGYRGDQEGLEKILIRPVVIKGADMLSFTYRYKTRDIVKNHGQTEAADLIGNYLVTGFRNATLFTAGFDLAYPSLQKSKPTQKPAADTSHDRSKTRHVETAGKQYLRDLKITDASGAVLKNAQDKFRQIDKYIEIIGGLLKQASPDRIKTIADMGSGKGYLTFALYDYLQQNTKIAATVTGVEYRKDMVELCSKIAAHSGFDRLKFVQGTIEGYRDPCDILIALHACDTATDDAIAHGIRSGSELIIVAPCCHKQVRRAMEESKSWDTALDPLLRHGTLLERQAEMVTDAIRALILEYHGYKTKAFEFISDAHTAKNVMITAVKKDVSGARRKEIAAEIAALKNTFGIVQHYLETLTDITA
ncbi:MAG: SAM-dependent methyltransferase [Micavibrio aeruginosavorus]|uniref:SAM-dependent methyltransferase n=1 Tax=Micavibrio aeruginosavorus TaxID=349221 RepID=A0A2W5A2J7_9BACT|nr:MAG: SAM-dependent methyltransferase [Micavibrio aeruginosavorus]